MSSPFDTGYTPDNIETIHGSTRIIYGDTETTGFNPFSPDDPDGDRIIEIGLVEYINGKPTGNDFHVYVDPLRDIPMEAVDVHGLSNDRIEALSGGQVFADIADDLVEYVRGAKVVIHNAEFDVKFFDAEMTAIGLPSFKEIAGEVVDSLAIARKRYPGKQNSLDALRRRLGVEIPREKHGALLDSQILGEVHTIMSIRQSALEIDEKRAVHSIDRIEKTDVNPNIAAALKTVRANPSELQAHDDMSQRLGF